MDHRWIFRLVGLCLLVAVGCTAEPEQATAQQPAVEQQAREARDVLEKYCYDCHGVVFRHSRLDVLDVATLIRPRDKDEEPFVVPTEPDKSRLYQQLAEGNMPPKGLPQPAQREKELIRDWIAKGAKAAPSDRNDRVVKGEQEILATIAKDLEAMPPDARHYARYFSLLHLWNDNELRVADLRLVRAAVSKLVNSLSDQPVIRPPRIVDAQEGLVLAIDLRDYGWQTDKDRPGAWSRLLAVYPYGLRTASATADFVCEQTEVELPYLRADWFVFHASRPPLYHDVLRLPDGQQRLEERLNVNARQNFAKSVAQRAAFRSSGVSQNNRVVQWQPIPVPKGASQRSYWNSFDFARDSGPGDAFAKPLGPIDLNSNEKEAFRHDGGEIIYHLPNHLSGYLLVDKEGARIDDGPIAIVNDPQQFSGSPAVINGTSCFGCHRQGYVSFKDTLRETFASDQGQVGAKVRELYPIQKTLDDLLRHDRELYARALDEAVLPFLRSYPDDDRTSQEFPEPITHVAGRYGRNLSFDKVGCELLLSKEPLPPPPSLPTLAQFKDRLANEQIFRVLGLTPLATGEIVDRTAWESIFLVTARQLELGTPLVLGGPRLISNSIDMQLVLIPAGKYRQGSPDSEVDRDFSETLRDVTIPKSFYLGTLEVTQDQYLRVTGKTPSFFSNEGARRQLVRGVATGRLPVDKVSGEDAKEFCLALSSLPIEREAGRSYRLPSDVEWEYACRARTTTPYYTGEVLSGSHAWIDTGRQPSFRWPEICGSFAPNAFGLYDMHGNVAEWCADSRAIPGTGLKEQVFRGGSWKSPPADCRSACRQYAPASSVTETIGFRVVCELNPPAK